MTVPLILLAETITLEQMESIKCESCSRVAICIGRYDADEGDPDEAACDECCGHGCEDGHCEQLYDNEGDPTDEGRARAAGYLTELARRAQS